VAIGGRCCGGAPPQSWMVNGRREGPKGSKGAELAGVEEAEELAVLRGVGGGRRTEASRQGRRITWYHHMEEEGIAQYPTGCLLGRPM
jgi:hypothetical protein